MQINALLEKINEGIYGEDIRQAIHDAILQCYIDANSNININKEIEDARGDYATLVGRLDNLQPTQIGGININDIEMLEEKTYTPGTTNITIKQGTYLNGNQIIAGDPNLLAKNIREGTTIFGVKGTLKPDANADSGDGGDGGDGGTITKLESVSYNAISTKTYRSSIYNNWTSDDYCRQGEYTDNYGNSYGDCNGYMFFGTQFENLKDKNLSKIELTVTRQSGAGSFTNVTFVFQAHGYENKPIGVPTYLMPCNATITLTRGTTGTVSITDTNVLNAIKDGTCKGFGIKSDYTNDNYGNLENISMKAYYTVTTTSSNSNTIAKVKILADNLNVRSGGGTNYNYVGIAKKDEVYEVVDTDPTSGWYQISYKGSYGWITNKTAYVQVIQGTVPVEDNSSTTPGDTGNGTIAISEKRNKIIERGEEAVALCQAHKMNYSQMFRTYDWSKPNTIKSMSETVLGTLWHQPSWVELNKTLGIDCSSLAGVCYQNAGINTYMNLSCAVGTFQSTLNANGATFIRYVDDPTFSSLKPGDLIFIAKSGYTVSKTNMSTVRTTHVMVFAGMQGNLPVVIEAAGYTTGIVKRTRTPNSFWFYAITQELKVSDSTVTEDTKVSSTEEYHNCYNERGIINNNSYIYRLENCRFTCYASKNSYGGAGSKLPVITGHTCACNNLPYGTMIYIPKLDGYEIINDNGKKEILNGIFVVNDCGVGMFDCDIFMGRTSSQAFKNMSNPLRGDVYILSWGNGYGSGWSFLKSYEWAYNNGNLAAFKSAFRNYMVDGGTLINFTKFKSDDLEIRNSKYWSILNG